MPVHTVWPLLYVVGVHYRNVGNGYLSVGFLYNFVFNLLFSMYTVVSKNAISVCTTFMLLFERRERCGRGGFHRLLDHTHYDSTSGTGSTSSWM